MWLNRLARRTLVVVLCAVASPRSSSAQENYEIQVYGSETVPRGHTMVELHSNYTLDGQSTMSDGTYPTNHAQHETLEMTHGFSDWFEIGAYLFTSARSGEGVQWVGDHIRPRVRAPESWGWPVGVSISQEIGYQRAEFSPDTWTYELRPIVDKKAGRWYAAMNPAFEKSLHGPAAARGFEFSPNASVGFDVTHKVNAALEYYGAWGPVRGLDAPSDREQQLYGALNLDLGPDWEFNIGYGQSFTSAGDHRLVKVILGRLLDR